MSTTKIMIKDHSLGKKNQNKECQKLKATQSKAKTVRKKQVLPKAKKVSKK